LKHRFSFFWHICVYLNGEMEEFVMKIVVFKLPKAFAGIVGKLFLK